MNINGYGLYHSNIVKCGTKFICPTLQTYYTGKINDRDIVTIKLTSQSIFIYSEINNPFTNVPTTVSGMPYGYFYITVPYKITNKSDISFHDKSVIEVDNNGSEIPTGKIPVPTITADRIKAYGDYCTRIRIKVAISSTYYTDSNWPEYVDFVAMFDSGKCKWAHLSMDIILMNTVMSTVSGSPLLSKLGNALSYYDMNGDDADGDGMGGELHVFDPYIISDGILQDYINDKNNLKPGITNDIDIAKCEYGVYIDPPKLNDVIIVYSSHGNSCFD